jgi:phosphotransferase system HPr (HPr) family protein
MKEQTPQIGEFYRNNGHSCIDVVVGHELGIHVRVAAQVVKRANDYQSVVEILSSDHIAPANSMMSVMMLAASKGTRITLRAPYAHRHSEDNLKNLYDFLHQG